MPRIIAGSAKGSRIQVPAKGTRPTSERAREALFSRLESWDALTNARVLDLYAGSGALALEALSRGARRAVVVENGRQAARVAQANVVGTGFQRQAKVRSQTAAAFLEAERTQFDLVFMDPPYDQPDSDLRDALRALVPLLDKEATVVVERQAAAPSPELPPELFVLDSRRWGAGRVWFLGHVDSADAPE